MVRKLDQRRRQHAAHVYVADNVEAYAKGAPIFAWSGDDTLTASSGNDTLVFANKIGNDVVHNFDAAHDKIDLIGFDGFASFADVQAHLGHDAAGNAVITLADGETITLNGVDARHRSTPATSCSTRRRSPHNTGDMVISDGALLPLSGVVDNTGSIHLGSAGNETDLEIVQHGVTLAGRRHADAVRQCRERDLRQRSRASPSPTSTTPSPAPASSATGR